MEFCRIVEVVYRIEQERCIGRGEVIRTRRWEDGVRRVYRQSQKFLYNQARGNLNRSFQAQSVKAGQYHRYFPVVNAAVRL